MALQGFQNPGQLIPMYLWRTSFHYFMTPARSVLASFPITCVDARICSSRNAPTNSREIATENSRFNASLFATALPLFTLIESEVAFDTLDETLDVTSFNFRRDLSSDQLLCVAIITLQLITIIVHAFLNALKPLYMRKTCIPIKLQDRVKLQHLA